MSSFNDEYNKLRKKRLEEQAETRSSVPYQRLLNPSANITPEVKNVIFNDIAPVKTTATTTEKEEDKEWYENFFQAGAFKDGYDIGDITKTILGTVGDLGLGFVKGIYATGEGLSDLALYGVGGLAGLFGANEFAEELKNTAKKDTTGQVFGGAEKWLDDYSVVGDTSTAIAQGLGQVGLMIASGGMASAGGAGTVGSTLATTGLIGTSAVGSGMSEAYQGGATDEQALTYGLWSGAVEAGAEMLFGGLGKTVKAVGISKGLSSLDDIFAKKLSSKISNQFYSNLAEFGVKASAEGAEEVLAGIGSAVGKWLTYASEEKNIEDLQKLIEDENLLEQFVVGAVTSGIAQSGIVPGMQQGSLSEANKLGQDFITGLTQNEQAVVDKEFNNRLAEAEQDGNKLSKTEQNDLYDKVVKDLEKGYISTDVIEEVLGGEDYANYKNELKHQEDIKNELKELSGIKKSDLTTAQEDRIAELKGMTPNTELVNSLKFGINEKIRNALSSERNGQGSYLFESYNEQTRRGQAFEADLSKYDSKQAEIVKRAIDSGILNNTNRTHDFVDMVAKISADKGVLFDFANNAKLKESGFAVDGKFVNGYVTKDGITVNIDSNKALNSIVGHEITHVLEGTELYAALKVSITEYAKSKGDYQSRIDTLTKLYEGVEGADVSAELTADLVGDYLFTDEDFINHLSTTNRNVFQRIYDEIKYLYKIATAGSKQARELEKVKRAFDKAYRESGKTSGDIDTKYSIKMTSKMPYNEQLQLIEKGQMNGSNSLYIGNPSNELQSVRFFDAPFAMNQSDYRKSRRESAKNKNYSSHAVPYEFFEKMPQYLSEAPMLIDNGIKVSVVSSYGMKDAKGNDSYVIAGVWMNQSMESDTVNQVKSVYPLDDFINRITKSAEDGKLVVINKNKAEQMLATIGIQPSEVSRIISLTKSIISQNSEKSTENTKFSLSDSDGKKLTKEQSEYFKDSKMRDDNGNLKVMYHGSQDAGFHTFDSKYSDDDTSFFFVDRNDVAASYSGTSETYAPKAFKSVQDANKFFAEINATEYEVVENNGKYTLLEDGDEIATSDDLAEIYEEWRDWSGLGYGDANYKVYLNLTNPLVVDAEGRNWNNISREFSQEVADRYHSLTAEEKAALTDLAEWGEYGIFRDEILSAAKAMADGKVDSAYTDIASAYKKLGGANANLYDAFSIAENNFSEESIKQFAVKQFKTRDYAQKAKAEGYDGVIFKNIHDNGGYSNGNEGASTVAIAFNSNQIKSIANDKPTKQADIRYSLSDSEGTQLTKEQQEYFKDSKIRNENGSLKVMHHGSFETFTVFDKSKAKSSGTYGKGFYFTDSTSHAATYGKTYDVYLNITNPLQNGTNDITKDQIRKFVEALAENEDYGIENYGYDATIDSVTDSVWGKSDFGMILDLNISCVGNMVEAIELFNEVNGTDYNGIVAPTETVAFYPNQIKLIDNKSPTADKDIRYSLSETDKTYLEAVERGDAETAQKMVDEVAKNAGYTINAYHGTPNAGFTVFDKERLGKGNDQYGAGFYFTTDKTGASHYGNRVIDVALNINNPIRFTSTAESGRNLIDADIMLTSDQAYEVVKRLPNIYDAEESPLGDYFDAYWEVGAKDWMIRELAEQYRDVGYLDSDLFRNYPNELHEALRDVVGWDGVEVTFERTGEKFYVAWFDNQMKSTEPITYDDNGNVIPLSERFNSDNNDIRYSLSDTNEAPKKTYGNYNIYGKDIRLPGAEDIAPVGVAENAITTPSTDLSEKVDGFGDDYAPVINSYTIEQEIDEIGKEIEALANESTELYNNGDEEAAMNLLEKINELSSKDKQLRAQAETLKAQEEADRRAYMDSITDADMPMEAERAYSEADTTPLDDKTLKVLTRNVRNVLSSMPKENKAIREVIEKYSTSEQTKSELFRELKDKFGDKYEYHRYSDIAEAKKTLRTYKFNVSDQVKSDIADFRDYKKSHNVRTSKNGLSVDVLYEELSELYPGLFPADITNETDKFERISEVSVMPAAEWVKVAELSDDEIMQAVDFIHNEVTQHKNNATRKAAEADARAYIDDVAPSRAKEITEKPLNDTAPRYQDINSRLEQEKATLTKEFEQKKAQMQSELANKNAFISNKAKELYNEIRNLKKGVRASKELGYILDHGYEWKSIKTALINAMNSPGKIVNTNSAAEGVVREVLKDVYESSMYDLSDMDNEYQKQLAKLEAKAEKERSGVQIKTVKERVAEKLSNVETELVSNKRLRAESIVDFNREIARLQEEYNSKANKNTQAANDILRRIERLQRMKNNVDADYEKRISDLESKKAKLSEEARTGTSATEQAVMRAELHLSKIDNIRAKFAEKGLDFDKTLKNAKDLSTFTTVDNTPQRVMEKSLGYREGQILADETVNKVAQNETEGIKWLNSYTDRKNGLLAQISKQYNIKPGSKESAAAQMYAEGFYVNKDNEIIKYGDNELAADFPNVKVRENIKGLARDTRIRKIYDDTLDMINDSRARNAYPEIQKLDNYFLHFRAMDDTFSQLGLPFNPNDIRAKDLPTDLNGVTADLKPGQPYFASSMHREGIKTSYDLLGGLERYLSSAKNQIYHIDDIQTLRALRNHIADTYGQANGLEGLDALSEAEAQEKIKQVFNAHLSTFAKFLNEEANIIAGKTALIDRGFEGIFGRRAMTFMDTLNKQVGANMVGFNVSSSLTNFIAPVQAFAKTNKVAFVKGFAQTVSNKLGSIVGKTDGFAEKSPVIIRRKGADRFYRTPYQKLGDAGYVLMSAVDDISTEIIARAKYNELTSKGMSADQAHLETDKWVSRLMGDRSLGQMPQLYNSKTLGLITKFQLEVRNQLDSQFYDTIQEAKADNAKIENTLTKNAKTAAKVTSTFVQLAIAQHLFGKAFESIAGYNPAFDIIEVIMTALGFDDDEESEDTALDNIQQGFLALLEDLPYTSTLTGGRIPISSALPITELIKGEDEYGNEKSRLETLGEIAPYYILPGGYGQIKKTIQGLGMFSDEHPIAGSYTDSGKLRFPVDDTLANRVQAGIFGQYASQNARDYFDNDIAPLNEKQIQEFIDVDMPIQDYWDYREGLSKYKTLAEKANYINSLDLTDEQKNVLINNIADRKEDIDMSDYDNYDSFEEFDFAQKNPEKYEFWKQNGISYEDYASGDDDTKAAYNWAYENPEKFTLSKAVASDVVTYRQYTKELNDLKADKDKNGNSISGSRKKKVINYINNLDADYGSKIILFKSEYPSDDTYNYDIVEYLNSRDDISYKEMETILKELGFTVDSNGRISWD